LDTTTGELNATRRHRTWRSLPRGTPLAHPDDPDDQPQHPALPF
jgi:hypothetical protein